MRYLPAPIVLLLSASMLVAAPPPDLPYLTDLPAGQVVHNPSVGRRVILASDASQANQTRVWALFSDASIIRYFENAKHTVVIYLDAESDDDPYLESLSLRALPSVVVSSRDGMLQRRLETFEKPYELIRWLEDAGSGQHLYDQLYRRVAVRPEDLAARFELLKELSNEDMKEFADMLYPWLFNRNDLWFQYEQGKQGVDFEEEQFQGHRLCPCHAHSYNLPIVHEPRATGSREFCRCQGDRRLGWSGCIGPPRDQRREIQRRSPLVCNHPGSNQVHPSSM